MGYLGNTPGENFITFSKQVFTIVNSQTAYTLDFAVVDENELRLVINNVVQEPGTGKAYTASGNTLTLASALTNGTDEMYCIFLGKARETVTVPDITRDKLNLISDASNPSLIAKGTSGVSEGYIQLNCAENSHGIKLKSPPHSAGQSYTLTFPQSISADTFLKTDGSGNLSFAAAGESNLPYFYVTRDSNQTMSASTHTVLQFDSVEFDTCSGYNTSNYRYTPNVAGKYYFEACLQFTYTGSLGNTVYQYIRKNATAVAEASNREGGYGSVTQSSTILTMNGSSDYVDIEVYGNPSGNFIAEGNGTNKRTYFLGFLLSAT